MTNVGNETSNDATLTGNLSANSKLLSDLTPPVTPDSTPMSIGNSPNFKQQPQSFLLLNQTVITKKHVSNIVLILFMLFRCHFELKQKQKQIISRCAMRVCWVLFLIQTDIIDLYNFVCCCYRYNWVLTGLCCLLCMVSDFTGHENQTFHTRQGVATKLKCWWRYFLRYGWLGHTR